VITLSDPWLFIGKLRAYASWWAGSDPDLSRPEVSPALGTLDGLPPTLMFCGSRDTLGPGCRLLAARAAETDWELTYVEEPDLLHVYPILPFVPEARVAWRRTLEFLA
jgi:monoterpene epsilon-lactone hydrolase